MIELRKPAAGPEEVEMVDLFRIEDGPVFRIPAKPKVGFFLRFARAAHVYGEDQAGLLVLADLLGEDAFNALCELDWLDPEDLKAIVDKAVMTVMGANTEDADGTPKPIPARDITEDNAPLPTGWERPVDADGKTLPQSHPGYAMGNFSDGSEK